MKFAASICIIACAAFAPAAIAGDMSGLYGNTIVCHYADGKVTKVWVAAGGQYSIQRPDGSTASGSWKDDGSSVCYMDANPAPGMKPVCSSSQLRKVGDSWDVTDPFGGHCTATLMLGHQ